MSSVEDNFTDRRNNMESNRKRRGRERCANPTKRRRQKIVGAEQVHVFVDRTERVGQIGLGGATRKITVQLRAGK